MNEFTEALESFNNSLKRLNIQRSVDAATSEIEGLRQQEASDKEVRVRQNELANQLGQQMIGYGYPAAQIQVAQRILNPQVERPQFTNVAELFAYGSPEQKQSYIEAMHELRPPKEVDQDAAALRRSKKEEHDFEFKTKTLTGIRKAVNEAETSSRNTMGVLAQKANTLTDLNGLIGDQAGWKDKTSFHIQELVTGLDRVFKGGVATESGISGLMPHNVQMKIAKLKELGSSKPTAANQAEFIHLYNDAIQRTGQIVEAQLSSYKKHTLAAIPSIAAKYSDDYPQLILEMTGEKGGFDKKAGRVVFENDAEDDKIAKKIEDLAGAKLPPEMAAKALQGIESEPRFWDALTKNKKLTGKLRAIKGRLNYGGQ